MKRAFVVLALALIVLVALLLGSNEIVDRHDAQASRGRPAEVALAGIHKIRHVVIIMQENRSFDSYFGTYPGADGIPGLAGHPGAIPCLPDPRAKTCVKPYHDTSDRNSGGPHDTSAAIADIDGGKMDGFEAQARDGRADACRHAIDLPACSLTPSKPDVMGYHDWHEIPSYWAYARNFVLQDHMFESVNGWSLPAHLAIVSGWSARCSEHDDPMSCKTTLTTPYGATGGHKRPDFPWTDLTYLLHRDHVSWRYFVATGTQPDCATGAMFCRQSPQSPTTPSIWNPLPRFDDVQDDHQTGNVVQIQRFYADAHAGRLPAVSWVVPSQVASEHPPALVTPGQTYVTRMIDAVMRSSDWKSTAIFLAWDDWGGFYDNLRPPAGYGLRVPALIISPYAKKGYVDHQVLSFDAYLKFIEDDFLHAQRLNPKTDGRPDSRPSVFENAKILGNIVNDFDFQQKPRPPLLLPLHPPYS